MIGYKIGTVINSIAERFNEIITVVFLDKGKGEISVDGVNPSLVYSFLDSINFGEYEIVQLKDFVYIDTNSEVEIRSAIEKENETG